MQVKALDTLWLPENTTVQFNGRHYQFHEIPWIDFWYFGITELEPIKGGLIVHVKDRTKDKKATRLLELDYPNYKELGYERV